MAQIERRSEPRTAVAPGGHRPPAALLPGCMVVLLGVFAGSGGATAQEASSIQLPPPHSETRVGFTYVSSVRELPDGRLLLVDNGENRLRVLNWSSGSVHDIGREGDGPGEYRSVGWLHALSGSTTLLTDESSHRWYILEGAEIERTIAASNPIARRVKDEVGRFFGTADGRRFLSAEGYRWDPSVSRESYQNPDSLVALLIEADADLEEIVAVDTVAVLEGRGLEGDRCALGMGGGGGERTCSPFASEDVAHLFDDGWLAIARVRPYRVDWRTPDGRWIRGEPLEPEGGPSVDRRQQCWYLQGYPATGPEDCDESRVDSWGWPDAMPAFLPGVTRSLPGAYVPVVLPTPEGNVLIRRAPLVSSPFVRYDLVDRTGTLEATLELRNRRAIVGFGEDVVYTIRTDGYDLQWLRRHAWPVE